MKITVANRIAVLIRERQINSASEFGRRMTAAGFPISSSHASRYEKDVAPAFDLKFIITACNVLQCLPNDLYNITIELEENETLDPTLTLPRHAIVLRTGKTEGTGSASQTAALMPHSVTQATGDKSQPASQATNKSNLKQVVNPDEDAGPSGILFPFAKPRK